jgi:hypothetical protein
MARSLSCGGLAVLKLRLRAPVFGVWVARVRAAGKTAVSGAVTLTDGTNSWKGTVVPGRSGVVTGVCSALIVGGAGKLGSKLPAKSYTGAQARLVVQDLLTAAGEQADGVGLTSPLLRTVLNFWTRSGGAGVRDSTAGEELTRVLEAVDATWRVKPSGAVWAGANAFPSSKPAGIVETDREPASGRVEVMLDGLDLVPATTVGNDRVGDVEYRTDGGALFATYWTEAA